MPTFRYVFFASSQPAASSTTIYLLLPERARSWAAFGILSKAIAATTRVAVRVARKPQAAAIMASMIRLASTTARRALPSSARSMSAVPSATTEFDAMDFQTQLYINGEFVDAKTGAKFPTVNPVTEEVITYVQEAGAEDVDAANFTRYLNHASRRPSLDVVKSATSGGEPVVQFVVRRALRPGDECTFDYGPEYVGYFGVEDAAEVDGVV